MDRSNLSWLLVLLCLIAFIILKGPHDICGAQDSGGEDSARWKPRVAMSAEGDKTTTELKQRLAICRTAKELLQRTAQPLNKYRGVRWNMREWKKFRHELAHGQDTCHRQCTDWATDWNTRLSDYPELRDMVSELSEAIVGLYNGGYDCAHNRSRRNQRHYRKAGENYYRRIQQIQILCPEIVTPGHLAIPWAVGMNIDHKIKSSRKLLSPRQHPPPTVADTH